MASNHSHNDGSSTRAYTVEQKAAVLRVKKCGNTDYYDILGLEEKKAVCTDAEIKKAYRKLSLLTHPDKNGYTGADEAFKKVSRAFQILSDPDKKSKYDKFGGDPESRFSGASASGASPFSGFASQRAPRGGPMFEEEISPEELFRQFFGGGMGGGPFGGGPFGGFGGNGFVFNMNGGGPGVRIHQMGGGVPRRRPHNHANQEPASPLAALQSLLPLLLLFIVPLLSSLFSGSAPTYPSVRYDNPLPPQTLHHVSSKLKVDYYVNPVEINDYTPSKWKNLDKYVEQRYVQRLSSDCEWQMAQRQRAFQEAQGFWSRNEEKWEQATNMGMPACKKLEGWGYRIAY
ncbi:hypothetical protein WHR41_04654 [Cladosporium halotolerans]|uniref:J domain-containing protein n=1 Tax=Cladosporium halotolerans TaxID=1052096 RepID=A0AB34KT22_9PEZI